MSFEERLEYLRDIKQYLLDERKFYLSRKDWPKVTVYGRKLKECEEQIHKVTFHKVGTAT